MTSLTKNLNPKTKNKFFHCKLQDLPSLQRLNSSLALTALELGLCKVTCEQAVFA